MPIVNNPTNDGRTGFPVRLFINGHNVGGSSSYMEWAEDVEAARAECARYFGNRFHEVETAIADLPQWEGCAALETIVVRCHRNKPDAVFGEFGNDEEEN